MCWNRKKKIELIGGKQLFSLLDVRDAASGLVALSQTKYSQWKKIYNLGWHNKVYSLVEIAELTKSRLEKRGYSGIDISLQRKDDIRTYAGMDATSFFQDTGWTPRYDIEDTIDKTIDEYIDSHK
ncbi:NAD(P)-dependent oxidoreductase [Pyramidobacter sp. YE332]|uniref:NAD(P)-dependent oxidoreductase n=1 Tax=Pyramidobacter sp. YE332 TaxID=3068894 RepID=UPI00294B8A7A|nr:NAD(P)-dependent oxidoreductase [Pyramidobacter sp. YE332]WOL38944.1 NAD(P)-dependent oxidoreductase [Pyramidobacter sp. YE332]